MTQEEAAQLLQKYLDGKANQNEIRKIEEWYGALPNHEVVPRDRKLQIAADMRLRISNAIQVKKGQTKMLNGWWLKIAALLVVCLSIGLLFWKTSKQGNDSPVELTVFTKTGERKEITLPDSSKVILEPATRISYPVRFSSQVRMVKLLSGNAFFSVVHQPKRSFYVKLNANLGVKVLGTSFRIRDVANETLLKVTVSTGKVAVQQGAKPLAVLVKGQQLCFNKLSKQSSVDVATHPNIVKLSFDGSSLAEVIKKMEYTYNINIAVSDQRFLKLKCTAGFNSGQQPSEILDILCRLHHLRFTESKDHKTFKIYK